MMRNAHRDMIGALAIVGAIVLASGSAASAQTRLRVIIFPTLANIAQYAAQAQGYYAKRGLEVELVGTPNSDETREGLAQGRYQIAHGGVDKSFAGAILNPPFTLLAQDAGLKELDAAIDVVGPYQSDGGWVLRSWAKANEDTLVRYIAANIEGMRFALDRANTDAMSAIVAERLKLAPAMAARAMRFVLDKKGFAPDARFDMEGFRNALKLRAEMLGTWGGTPPAPEKYLDLTYYQRALAGL